MAARKAQTFVGADEPGTILPSPTVETVLMTLTEARILDLCRLFGCDVHQSASSRDKLVRRLSAHVGALAPLLRELGRDELRRACERHGVSGASQSRAELSGRLLSAAGIAPGSITVRPPAPDTSGLPRKGDVVHARHRQWLVEKTEAGIAGESPLVRLVCLDDDDPGRTLEVLWDLELGAVVVDPQKQTLSHHETPRLDPPLHFGAYLHALKWSCVSAADATRFQAPYRAGIKIMAHQLTPLMKALELPRANLFIADDVGLGKTIEAGLVLQELILRQQAGFVLVSCPASVCLQWQSEMQKRFGLRFEVMTRQFVGYLRQDRGFGTNPWGTHNRFIISHSLLRRPGYKDPLVQQLGERARKGLFILDEAHVAAPASASKYATDTEITQAVRDLAPRFDNRLFLSATPHNGHTNSFSALLEILDPIRFTRGVPVDGKKDLSAVMVRRLKRDLRQLGVERFPRRLLVELSLEHNDDSWTVVKRSFDADTGNADAATEQTLGIGASTELRLATALARYTELCAPTSVQGRLPFIHLQQRLLSSPEAFARTIRAHAEGLHERGGLVANPARALPLSKAKAHVGADADPELYGPSDESLADEAESAVRMASAALPSPTVEATDLLREMQSLAEQARAKPDAKTLALFAWMREHMCPIVGLGRGATGSPVWTDRRVILFTEYADTKRYLVDLLNAAIAFTDSAEQRVLQFHGGMGDDARDEVQRAFNTAPKDHPVRILVATDAAREGVNLQAHCADLFHFDIPWNPSRMEQRNGRIDRTMQPADEVRCHYFLYPQRTEDQVLQAVLRKVSVVERELGSLGAVLLAQLEKTLSTGISKNTQTAVEGIGSGAHTAAVDAELEAQRKDLRAVGAEVEKAARRLDASKSAFMVLPDSLRGVVEIGLEMAVGELGKLTPKGNTSDGRPTYTLPQLDRTWEKTLDTLRPPRGRDEAFWEWRKQAPRPVTFHPLASLSEDAEQLHLAHPLVKRILDRFLAQGFGAHDLSRVTAVVAPDESVARVVGFARLTLFGAGAARLHDEIVAVAAPWPGDDETVTPYKDRATAQNALRSTEALLATSGVLPNETIKRRICEAAGKLAEGMWPHLEAEADAVCVGARQGLLLRASREADEMRGLLLRQQKAIGEAQGRLKQLQLFEVTEKDQKRQVGKDLTHLEHREKRIVEELETEPQAIEALYDVRMQRLTPVGLVVAWPESMT